MPALHARSRSQPRRRGVTLLEMLVAVALLVLLMTVLVSVFGAATSAVSGQRVYQELDGQLRQLDGVLRQDLTNVWAQMTPPCDPNHGGYFEYGENAFADWQGEDVDDYVRFTTKAPEGSYFTGRTYVLPTGLTSLQGLSASQLNVYLAQQPITVTSEFAEVIYFVRNGNLYRRVFLVAPERQGSVNNAFSAFGLIPVGQRQPYYSAQVQDPSYYLNSTSSISAANPNMVPLSWLGVNDLSAHPAPTNPTLTTIGKLVNVPPILNSLADLTNRENRAFYQRFANAYINVASGLADDENIDGADDWVRTLYNGVFSNPNTLIFETSYPPTQKSLASKDTMAFPYIFPGAYSQPDPNGWIHSLDPSNTTPAKIQSNQDPLLVGDNHVPAISGALASLQTWWGFPTWRETLGYNWHDPYWQVNVNHSQAPGLSLVSVTALPAVLTQPFNDGAGSATFASTGGGGVITTNPALWEDDLIMTNVRSFDVKAYDDSVPGYVDLGWGDDPKVNWIKGDTGFPSPQGAYLTSTPAVTTYYGSSHYTVVDNPAAFKKLTPPTPQTFAHEGRIPPLVNDNRLDAQFGQGSYSGFSYTGNVGDNQGGVVRLRRVWDSWSTAYTEAPQKAFNPSTGFPIGPPFSPPVYPSFPPPYPAPLRGIQIQIRVVDPRNERIKVLTIRQDFSDKL